MENIFEKYGLDAGRGEAIIDECVQSVVQNIQRGDKKTDHIKLIWYRLLDAVKGRQREEEVKCSPEEVAVMLLRSGVPKENVTVTHNRLTIKLEHCTYRIYRGTSAFPSGMFRIIRIDGWPFTEDAVVNGLLPTEELVDFLRTFDGLVPLMQEKGRAIKKALEEYAFEQKKKAIEADIIRCALADAKEALEQQNISVDYRINDDGTISMDFEQYLSAHVTTSIGELRTIISDPEKVRSMLTPGQRQTRRMSMFGGTLRLWP